MSEQHRNDGPEDDEDFTTDDADQPDPVGYTVPSDPPDRTRRQRRSWWAEVFDEARRSPGEWRLVLATYSMSTANQVASDIRSSHRRDPDKMRLRGLSPSERWDARSAPAPVSLRDGSHDSQPHSVWIMYVCGPSS